jgi:hypothetical protein
MKRREFTAGLGGATAAWSLTARVQEVARPVVGWICPSPWRFYPSNKTRSIAPEAGFLAFQILVFQYRSVDFQLDRLVAVAAEFVRRRVGEFSHRRGISLSK